MLLVEILMTGDLVLHLASYTDYTSPKSAMGWQSTSRYLEADKLQKVLEKKFKKPSGYDFKIKVRSFKCLRHRCSGSQGGAD